jgi:NAD(P)H dehydrogenase (quinone)
VELLMRVLLLYCHPNPESYVAALHRKAAETLIAAGHEVDVCDLYAEGFNPVLSREERIGYHDHATNTQPVLAYVERLRRAEALVLVFPVWNFGFPALLKGFFDRVFLPGVSFDLEGGQTKGLLTNIRKIQVITTYGGSWMKAALVGNPPRKYCTRAMRAMTQFSASIAYLAHYDMNLSTPESRASFLDRVTRQLARL